ncbi:MAG TPA: FecR family protein [Burkholderiales bacterium]|nr:FecR family protein [Burkholderiales bacterium]
MKNIAALIVSLALLPAVSSAAPAPGVAAGAAESRIYVVSGNVSVTQGRNPAHRVIDNEPIASNTLVNTGDKSAALLRFEDGQVVTLQANSSFNVREYHYDAKRIENSNIVFSVFSGGMRFITGLIGQHKKQAFRLSTPNATIGIRGTEFMVTMAGKSMYSRVLSGGIAMTNAAGTAVVGAGQSAVVPSSGALATLVSASALPAGTFSELLSIPVQPSGIPAPAPEPAPGPAPATPVEPAPAAVPEPAAVPDVLSDAAGAGAATGAAAGAAGTSLAVAGGALAALAGSDSDSDSASTAAGTQGSPEPAQAPEEKAPAQEADKKALAANSRSDVGLTGKIGTLGYGLELNLGLSDSVSARLGINAFSYKYNATSSTVNYDFKLQLRSASALADWYPFEGSFRTSAGVLYNDNKVSLDALPTGGTYTINGTTYAASDVGSMQGTMTFNKVAPYFGIGWGNPVAKNKGWGMVSDIGVLFQGQPRTSLVATCGATLPAPQCTALQKDAAAENAKLESDLKNFKWWPVVSIGISYQW